MQISDSELIIANCVAYLLMFVLVWMPFFNLVKRCYRISGLGLGALGGTGFLIVTGITIAISNALIMFLADRNTVAEFSTIAGILQSIIMIFMIIIAVTSLNRLWRQLAYKERDRRK